MAYLLALFFSGSCFFVFFLTSRPWASIQLQDKGLIDRGSQALRVEVSSHANTYFGFCAEMKNFYLFCTTLILRFSEYQGQFCSSDQTSGLQYFASTLQWRTKIVRIFKFNVSRVKGEIFGFFFMIFVLLKSDYKS